MRVAPHDTLLYVGCDNPEDEQYEDFQALEKQLRGPLHLGGIPLPLAQTADADPIYDEGDCLTTNPGERGRPPACHLCQLPDTEQGGDLSHLQSAGKDEEARKQIQLAFPDREIIGVDSQTIIRQHGSIHCITMQLPEGALRDSTFNI